MTTENKKIELNFLNSLYSKDKIFDNINIVLNVLKENSVGLMKELEPVINELEIEKLTNQDYEKYDFTTENEIFRNLIGENAIVKEAVLLKKSYDRYLELEKKLEATNQIEIVEKDITNYQEILADQFAQLNKKSNIQIIVENGHINIHRAGMIVKQSKIDNLSEIQDLIKYLEKNINEENFINLLKGYEERLNKYHKIKNESKIKPLSEIEIAELLKYASVFDEVIPKIENFIRTRKLNIGAEILIEKFLYSEDDSNEDKRKKVKYYNYLNKNLFNLTVTKNKNLYQELESNLSEFENELKNTGFPHTPEGLFGYLSTLSKEEVEALKDSQILIYREVKKVRNNIEGKVRKIFKEKMEIYKIELVRLEKQLIDVLNSNNPSPKQIKEIFKKMGKTIKNIKVTVFSSLEEVYDLEKMRTYDNKLYSEIESNIIMVIGSVVIPDLTKKLNINIDTLLRNEVYSRKSEEWKHLLLERKDLLSTLTNEKFNSIEDLEYKLIEISDFFVKILNSAEKNEKVKEYRIFSNKSVKDNIEKEEQTFKERILLNKNEEFMINLKTMMENDKKNGLFKNLFKNNITAEDIFNDIKKELAESSILPEEFTNNDLSQLPNNYQNFAEKYKLFDFMTKEEKKLFNEALNDFKNEIDEIILKLLNRDGDINIEKNRKFIIKKFIELEKYLGDNIQILRVFKNIKQEQQKAAEEKNILKLMNLEISKEVTLELPNLIDDITNVIRIEDFNGLSVEEKEIAIMSRIEQLINAKLLTNTEKYAQVARKLLEKFGVVIEKNGALSVGIGYTVNKNLDARTAPVLSLAIENITQEAVKYYIKNNKEKLAKKINLEIRQQLGLEKIKVQELENNKNFIKTLINKKINEKTLNKYSEKTQIDWNKYNIDLQKEKTKFKKILNKYFIEDFQQQLEKVKNLLPQEKYKKYNGVLTKISNNVPKEILEKILFNKQEYNENEIINLMQNLLTPYIQELYILNNNSEELIKNEKLSNDEKQKLEKLFNLTSNNALMLLPKQMKQKIINEETFLQQKSVVAKLLFDLQNGKKIETMSLKKILAIQGTLRSMLSYVEQEKNNNREILEIAEILKALDNLLENIINAEPGEYIDIEKFIEEVITNRAKETGNEKKAEKDLKDAVIRLREILKTKKQIPKILDKYFLDRNGLEQWQNLSRKQIFLIEDLKSEKKNIVRLKDLNDYEKDELSDNMGYNVLSKNVAYFVEKGIENNSINQELLLGMPNFNELFGLKNVKQITTEERRKIKTKIASLSNMNEVFTILKNIEVNNKIEVKEIKKGKNKKRIKIKKPVLFTDILANIKTFGSNLSDNEIAKYNREKILKEAFEKEMLFFEYDAENTKIKNLIPDLENSNEIDVNFQKKVIQKIRNELGNQINTELEKIRRLSKEVGIENINKYADKIANELVNIENITKIIDNIEPQTKKEELLKIKENLLKVINLKELKRHVKYTIINYNNNNMYYGQFKLAYDFNKILEEKIKLRKAELEENIKNLQKIYFEKKGIKEYFLPLNVNKNKLNKSLTPEERRKKMLDNKMETIEKYNQFIEDIKKEKEIINLLNEIPEFKNLADKEKQIIIENVKEALNKSKLNKLEVKRSDSSKKINKAYNEAIKNSKEVFKIIKNKVNYILIDIQKEKETISLKNNIDKAIKITNNNYNLEKIKLNQKIERITNDINNVLIKSKGTLLNNLILTQIAKQIEYGIDGTIEEDINTIKENNEEKLKQALDKGEIKFKIEDNINLEEIMSNSNPNFELKVTILNGKNKNTVFININKIAYLKELKEFINNEKVLEDNGLNNINKYKNVMNEKIDNNIEFYTLKEEINKEMEQKYNIDTVNLFEIFSYLDANKSTVGKEEIWLDFTDPKVKNSINNLLFEFEIEDFKRNINEEFSNYYDLISKKGRKSKGNDEYKKRFMINIGEISKKLVRKREKIEKQLKLFETNEKFKNTQASYYYAKVITELIFTKEMYKMSNILNILNNKEANRKENLDIYSKMFLYIKNEMLNELYYEIDKGNIKTVSELKTWTEKLKEKYLRNLKINNALNNKTKYGYLSELEYILKNYSNLLTQEQITEAYEIYDTNNSTKAQKFIESLKKINNFRKLKVILKQGNLEENIEKEIKEILDMDALPEVLEKKAEEFLNKYKNLWDEKNDIKFHVETEEIKIKELNEFRNYLLNNLETFNKEKYEIALNIIQIIDNTTTFKEALNVYAKIKQEELYQKFYKNTEYLNFKELTEDLNKKEYFIKTIDKTINQEKSLLFSNLLTPDKKINVRTEEISEVSVILEKIFGLTENMAKEDFENNPVIKKSGLDKNEFKKFIKSFKAAHITLTDLKYIKFLLDKNIILEGKINPDKLIETFYGTSDGLNEKQKIAKYNELLNLFSPKVLEFIEKNKENLEKLENLLIGVEVGIQKKVRIAQSNLEKYKKTESMEKITDNIQKNITINKKHIDFIKSLTDKYYTTEINKKVKKNKKIIYVYGSEKPNLNDPKIKKLYSSDEEVKIHTVPVLDKTKTMSKTHFAIVKEINPNTNKPISYQIFDLGSKKGTKVYINSEKRNIKVNDFENKKFTSEEFERITIKAGEKKFKGKNLITNIYSLDKKKAIKQFFQNFNNIVNMYTVVESKDINKNSIYFEYESDKLNKILKDRTVNIDLMYKEVKDIEEKLKYPNGNVFEEGTYELKKEFYDKLVNFFSKYGFTFKFNHFKANNIEIDAKGNIKFYNPDTGIIENIGDEQTIYTNKNVKNYSVMKLKSNLELKEQFENFAKGIFKSTSGLIERIKQPQGSEFEYAKFNKETNIEGKTTINTFNQNYEVNKKRIETLEEEIAKYKKETVTLYQYDPKTNKTREVQLSVMEILNMEQSQNKEDSINTLNKLENLAINNRILEKAKEELKSEGINSKHLDYNQKLYQTYGKLLEKEIDRINNLDINERKKALENFQKEFIIPTEFAGSPIREVIVSARRNLEELEKQLKKEKNLKRRMDIAMQDSTIAYLIGGKDLTERNIYERHNVKALKANKWDESVRYLDQAIEYYQNIVNKDPFDLWAKRRLEKLQNKRKYLEDTIKSGIDITTPEGLAELKNKLKQYEKMAMFEKGWYETRNMGKAVTGYSKNLFSSFVNIFSGIELVNLSSSAFSNMKTSNNMNSSQSFGMSYGY